METLISIEFPFNSRKDLLVCEDFFFEKYNNNRISIAIKNFIKCKLKIGSKFLKPFIGEIFNVSDCVLEISHVRKTNIYLDISYLHRIEKKIKFRNFIDFEFLTGINLNFFDYKIKEPKRQNKNQILFTIPIDIIPPFFLSKVKKISLISNSLFNQIKETYSNDSLKTSKESTFMDILSIDKRSRLKKKDILEISIDFRMDVSPQICKKKQQLMFIPVFAIGFFIKIFKKRPIWVRKRLEKFLPISLKRYIKRILPFISYRFSGINPFKKGWIRFGFDPRKTKKSSVYQSIGICPKNTKKNKLRKTHNIKNNLYTGGIFIINSTKIKKIYFGQFCDLKNERIKALLKKKRKEVCYIHSITGWFSFLEIIQFKSFIK